MTGRHPLKRSHIVRSTSLEKPMSEIHPYAIVEIQVEGLFGYIDQVLTPTETTHDQISKLAILYGENGTGKTTLLRMAFYLLSPRIDRGHKTNLSAIAFKLLKISLRDGTTFQASRNDTESGDFLFSVKRPRRKILQHNFQVERDGTGIAPYQFSPDLQQAISDCASTYVFLRDDREIEIEPNDESLNPWDQIFTGSRAIVGRGKRLRLFEEAPPRRERRDLLSEALKTSFERLDRWFSIEYGQRTSSGMASSHTIYEEVIDRLVSPRSLQQPSLSLDSQIEQLLQLSETSLVFEKYGLSTHMNVQHIIGSLKKANSEQHGVLEELLAPYIQSVRARFSELLTVYETLDTFIVQTNQFMDPKTISYHVGGGLKILSPHQQPLNPTELSSGERHLLLILTTAVLARSNRTLFIIDEPEISLNTTWQRALAGALLAVSKDSVNQFLMASHSLALISDYRSHVLRLKHQKNEEQWNQS